MVSTYIRYVNYNRAHTDFESPSRRWAANGIQLIRLRGFREVARGRKEKTVQDTQAGLSAVFCQLHSAERQNTCMPVKSFACWKCVRLPLCYAVLSAEQISDAEHHYVRAKSEQRKAGETTYRYSFPNARIVRRVTQLRILCSGMQTVPCPSSLSLLSPLVSFVFRSLSLHLVEVESLLIMQRCVYIRGNLRITSCCAAIVARQRRIRGKGQGKGSRGKKRRKIHALRRKLHAYSDTLLNVIFFLILQFKIFLWTYLEYVASYYN